ncbi:MAG: hypothetical protein FWD73_17515 [Polyangiaceae bacterium]|nr:hypothetical protein [Polyangiaceae bacterium]
MPRSTIRIATVFLVIASFALGCELVVDFDRTKIPVEMPDTGQPTNQDASIFDASPSVDASDADANDADDSGDASDSGDADDAGDSGDADAIE